MLVLGSGSPRRKALLTQVGIETRVLVPQVDETWHAEEGAIEYVERMAREKLEACFHRNAAQWTLCADTVVVLETRVLGKPKTPEMNAAMLHDLSGRAHRVITAVSLGQSDLVDMLTVETSVHFRLLPETWVARYVQNGEGSDKAGGYAIQGVAGGFVERIEGSYSNVVGLPLSQTITMLSNHHALVEWP